VSRILALAAGLALLACEIAPPDPPAAPPLPRAAVRIDPPRLGVGQVGVVEILVVMTVTV